MSSLSRTCVANHLINFKRMSSSLSSKMAISRPTKMLKTLNVTDSTWTVPYPHIGSIGHVLPFPEACRMAEEWKFDSVNLDVDFAMEHGPEAVKNLLEKHGLQPAAFRFPVKISDEADAIGEDEFSRGLEQFSLEAPVCAAAGFCRTAMHLLPWSLTGTRFGPHFRLTTERLRRVGEVLRRHDIKLGLEFLGSYGNRRASRSKGQGFDFVHTVEGVRCLAAAAGLESHVGLKLDVHHWWATGGSLEELTCLTNDDIVYVELNDSYFGPSGSKLDTPEFLRDMPNFLGGNSDANGLMAVLQHVIGYNGPVVCEPFNRRMHSLTVEEAVKQTKESMDLCFKAADQYPGDLQGGTEKQRSSWVELTGTHAYNPDPKEEKVRAGGLYQGDGLGFKSNFEDLASGKDSNKGYVGEGGTLFSETNSEKAVIGTIKNIEGSSSSDIARKRQVSEALVKHLHAFIKDLEPSEEEWEAGVNFLLEAGHWSREPEKRHEWMMLSDTLGVTMLMDCINHRKTTGDHASTEWTVQGPFHGSHEEVPSHGSNLCLDGSDKDPDNKAVIPALVSGTVKDAETGKPIAGAKVDIWLTAYNGKYAVQDSNMDPGNLCGYLFSDQEGSFSFKAIKPTPYKVPEDGPGGALMSYMGREPWRPSHLHFIITAPGYHKVTTHLFVKDDPYLFSDAVFAVLDSLVVDWPNLYDEAEAELLGFLKLPYTKAKYDFKLKKIAS